MPTSDKDDTKTSITEILKAAEQPCEIQHITFVDMDVSKQEQAPVKKDDEQADDIQDKTKINLVCKSTICKSQCIQQIGCLYVGIQDKEKVAPVKHCVASKFMWAGVNLRHF